MSEVQSPPDDEVRIQSLAAFVEGQLSRIEEWARGKVAGETLLIRLSRPSRLKVPGEQERWSEEECQQIAAYVMNRMDLAGVGVIFKNKKPQTTIETKPHARAPAPTEPMMPVLPAPSSVPAPEQAGPEAVQQDPEADDAFLRPKKKSGKRKPS